MTKGYIKLYNEILSNNDLGLTEKVVLCYVNSFTSNNQPFRASNQAIAEALGLNEKTIRRAIKTLLEGGFLAKSRGISRFYAVMPKSTEEPTEEPTKKPTNPRKNQPKKIHEIPLPEWYEQYRQDLAKPQQKPDFTEQEQKEAMEFMKDFFSEDKA